MGKDRRGKEIGSGFSQRPDGRYQKVFRINGKQKCVYGSNLKECKAKYNQIMREVEEGIYSNTRKPTLEKYKEEWILNKEKTGRVRQSTITSYETSYKMIEGDLGQMRIDQIKPPIIKATQRKLLESYKPTTINKAIGVLSSIFESAIQDELILRNPCKAVKNVARGEKRVNSRALSEKELTLFMEYGKESYYYNAFRLLFATGIRSGELRGLRWLDYDLKNNVLHITRTASIDKQCGLVMNEPKTKNGRRDIPLNEQIISIIESQKAQYRMLNTNKVVTMDDYIFKSKRGKVVSRNVLNAEMNAICDRVKIDHPEFGRFSPHASRHTFITRALHQGMNEYVIKDIVGHSPSASVTTDIYLDREQSEMDKVMRRLKIVM